jgi:hypothetical protein
MISALGLSMKNALLLLAILGLSLAGADKKKKPADLTIIESTARRNSGIIALDGRVRNTGEKPIRGLILLFDFMAPGKQVISTEKGPVEDEEIEPGQESSFHLETNAPPRAVHYHLNAVDHSGRDLRVENAGPFAID